MVRIESILGADNLIGCFSAWSVWYGSVSLVLSNDETMLRCCIACKVVRRLDEVTQKTKNSKYLFMFQLSCPAFVMPLILINNLRVAQTTDIAGLNGFGTFRNTLSPVSLHYSFPSGSLYSIFASSLARFHFFYREYRELWIDKFK